MPSPFLSTSACLSILLLLLRIVFQSNSAFIATNSGDLTEAQVYQTVSECFSLNARNSSHNDIPTTEKYSFKESPDTLLFELKQVLSPEEVSEIRVLSNCIRELVPWRHEDRSFKDNFEEYGGNNCTYLQPIFQILLPSINQKICQAVHEATSDIPLEVSVCEMGVRCVEYLSYHQGGVLKPHQDNDSVFTLVILLNSAAEYEGGDFSILSQQDSSEEWLYFRPENIGDGLVFDSEIPHAVSPVTKGQREVLVIEYWLFSDSTLYDSRPPVPTEIDDDQELWEEDLTEEINDDHERQSEAYETSHNEL